MLALMQFKFWQHRAVKALKIIISTVLANVWSVWECSVNISQLMKFFDMLDCWERYVGVDAIRIWATSCS